MNNKKLISFIIRNNTKEEATNQLEEYVKRTLMNFSKSILKEKDEDPNEEWLEPRIEKFLANVNINK